ncbi:RHS repeat domain-containing protein [Photobacterium damselae]|uniref:RHS repeat domain-containing protein n=1 Tax=Photobacterium damselae TaxID=38293 RepID=UPI0025426FD1
MLFQGDAHFEYDEFGRLITERCGKNQTLVTHYEYDCQHRLIRATMPDGSQACYVYDAFGRRISKTVTDKLGQSSTTEFVWQGDKLLAEQTDGQNYQTYLYQPDSFKPLALLKGEGKACEIYHYHLDHLGTPTDLTDEQGNIVWQAQYRSYGDVVAQHVEKIVNPIRFQGQYYDSETGLHYNRHRYYSPKTGRFTTVDPIGLAGGLNNYQYVPNPVNWVDPLGLSNKKGNVCSSFNNSGVNSRNWLNQEVKTYDGHLWSPLDPDMREPPIVQYGPYTDEQRDAFLKGKQSKTFIAPHHRHQLSIIEHNGVIDELNGPGHPSGNNHTKLINGLNRHPGPSYFNQIQGGSALRAREIRMHLREKGKRLIKDENSNLWIDPMFEE